MRIRPAAFRLWLSGIDPGYIRFRGAFRAALALLSIWLVLRTAVQLLLGSRQPIPLYGVFSGMIFLLIVIDIKPSERRVSLWLAPIPFGGAVLLASLLSGYFWLNNLILLVLFFSAYFFRRYGPRAGEMALMATIGFYLGFLLHPALAIMPMFLAIVVVSVAGIYLWEFVIIPYDPARSLHQSVIAFYHNVGLTLATIRQGLEAAEEGPKYQKRVQAQFRRVHQNRRVIEGLFAALISPNTGNQARLNRLQVEMFKTERGLELLIEVTSQRSGPAYKQPEDVLQALMEGLGMLEADLWEISSNKEQSPLSDIGDWLQSRIKSSSDEAPADEWVYFVLRIGSASSQLARSVAEINALEKTWQDRIRDEVPSGPPAPHLAKPFDNRGGKAKPAFHPTTILGFQAVLATGLSMLAAYLLNLDQPNLVYWTAFVVIAGSTGESLRRMTLRVVGVIAGTVIGVLLAVVLPDNLWLTVLAISMCIFLMVYAIPASYIWMVFWLNIAMLLVITTLGGAALQLLILRPMSTLFGAAIAALVVLFVLPIHVQDRFKAALAGFLMEVDRYTEAYAKTLLGAPDAVELKAEELNIDTSYKKLELNLPNVAYEYNPLSRAQNRFADQATTLSALKTQVNNLVMEVDLEPGALKGVKGVELISVIQNQIHENIRILNDFLTNKHDQEMPTLTNLGKLAEQDVDIKKALSVEDGSGEMLRNRAIYHLMRIHDTLLQIALGFGTHVA